MNADIAIITTLDEEFDAVVKVLNLKRDKYQMRAYGSINGYNILCVKSQDRGNIESSRTTTELINNNNNLKYVFLVGYAGGVEYREGIFVNDVVVADKVTYYEYKKIDNNKILPREPHLAPPSLTIKELAKVVKEEGSNNKYKIIIGEILSGESIINKSKIVNKLLKRYDKAIALETEAGGVASAITKVTYNKNKDNDKVIHYAVIKGISDFINDKAEYRDENKIIASENAAMVTKAIIEKLSNRYKKDNFIAGYLRSVEELYTNKLNKLDGKALSEYYIKPNLIKTKIDSWNNDKLINNDIIDYNWCIDKFLESDEWRTVIGSEFGIGKSSYAKYIAYNLAKSSLDGKDTFIPIFIELKNGFENNNIYLGYTIDLILNKIKDRKILLILDGLDEYNGEIDNLLDNKLIEYKKNYDKLKVLITTRLIESYPSILKIKDYVRIKPFTKEQVNEFFNRYGVKDLSYDRIESLGLSDEEITKPLFVWMIAYMHKESNGLRRIDYEKLEGLDNDIKHRIIRTTLYHNFINAIVRGKHIHEASKEFIDNYIKEKRLLRVIAAIHNIYGKLELEIKNDNDKENDNDKALNKLVEPFGLAVSNFGKALEYVTESYFYTSTRSTYTNNQLVKIKAFAFIHKSIQEYLLAEYYYENIKNGGIENLNVGLPSKECIDFLHGLIDILKHYDKTNNMLEHLEGIEPLINNNDKENNDKEIIINNCKEIIKDKRIILYDVDNKDGFIISKDNNANRYSNLYIHRWIAVNILSWLSDEKDRKLADDIKEYLSFLIRETSHNTIRYLKYLEYLNLSGAKLSYAYLSEANLSGANLSGAKLSYAYLSEANLSGADLSGADLSGADLSGAKLSYAYLSGANLSYAYLSGANLSRANLSIAKLSGANLSRANLSYAYLSGADLSYAYLSYAYLSGADLSYAYLSGAKLSGADLFETNLSGADLSGADLSGAKLSIANLSRAKLSNVIFYLFSWEDEDIHNSNLANYLERFHKINIQEYKLTRNDKITLIKDNSKITIELKDNKAILTINNDKLKLDVIKEDKQTKIFIPIKVDEYTETEGIILTYSNDKDIIKALSNLHPDLRKIVLRDNHNYKEIWDESPN